MRVKVVKGRLVDLDLSGRRKLPAHIAAEQDILDAIEYRKARTLEEYIAIITVETDEEKK